MGLRRGVPAGGRRAAAMLVLSALTLLAAAGSAPASSMAIQLPPPVIAGARLAPAAFADLDGWAADDHAAAFATFRASCAALRTPPAEVGPSSVATLRGGLALACAAAARLGTSAPSKLVARLFFEANFRPWRVIPESGTAYFTGYYEPEVEGALAPGNGFDVPVYGRPADLVMSGSGPTPNSGGAMRRVGDALVPYFDRAAIEDGALAGRGLEIAWLKDPIDLFFMQIQGSARVRLLDGRVLRLNYDGYNGQPYVPVGRLLIARGQVPREEMSMDRIRAFMTADPEAARLLRRENPSYVFFKALELGAEAGAMGAQGVPLTAGRSLAVDRKLHTYGAPIFVEADLPLAGPATADPFRRLMVAQDTGSAIVGPARADLYFGTGAAAGAVAGRIRHQGRFTLLVPRLAPAPGGAP
ncbi:MltA domain-containing protein [Xanthobacter sp. KR7-65]|uniref:murein transglycosylase A n=1 Tax=Xanthobacter sp. KR7-65 TaxID=3156612 RepID=UPI0032B4B3F5